MIIEQFLHLGIDAHYHLTRFFCLFEIKKRNLRLLLLPIYDTCTTMIWELFSILDMYIYS